MPVLKNISSCLETKHGNFSPAFGQNFLASCLDLHSLFAGLLRKKPYLEDVSQKRFSLAAGLSVFRGLENGPNSQKRSRSRSDVATRLRPSAKRKPRRINKRLTSSSVGPVRAGSIGFTDRHLHGATPVVKIEAATTTPGPPSSLRSASQRPPRAEFSTRVKSSQ